MKKNSLEVLAVLFFGIAVVVSFFVCHNTDKYRACSIIEKEEPRNNFIKTNVFEKTFSPREVFCCSNISQRNIFFDVTNKWDSCFFVVKKANQEIIKKKEVTVIATAYYKPLKGEKNYKRKIRMNGTGKKTSSGTVPKRGTIAVDPNFIPEGTRFYVSDYGIGVAEDKGGVIKGNKIDLFMGEGKLAYNEAMKWGRKKIKVIILPPSRCLN